MYSHERYAKLVEETVGKIKELSTLKGGEYAGDLDRLANFRRNAERLGLSMEAIWAVYCNKHIDAINQYCSDIQSGKSRKRMESISGRADDVIVYMILFKAMVEERESLGITSTEETEGNNNQQYQKYLREYHGKVAPLKFAHWKDKFEAVQSVDEDARFEQDSYDKYIRACGRYSENKNNHLTFDAWKASGKPTGL